MRVKILFVKLGDWGSSSNQIWDPGYERTQDWLMQSWLIFWLWLLGCFWRKKRIILCLITSGR